ncbi:MAG: HD-GYP domain-containing protein [Gammaproteobacteria bacterium]|nr:HD-GYP domain-containing protein [Gammaproteobacteria bacterium]
MKKQIPVEDVTTGMYISELDRPWTETPFLFQGFKITNDNQINELRKRCTYVYIDIELGEDVSPTQANSGFQQRMQVLKEKEKTLNKKFDQLISETKVKPKRYNLPKTEPYVDKKSFEEELATAKKIESDARVAIRAALESIRNRKTINLEAARKVITNMADSVLRNPDALMCLSQLKELSEYTALHSIRCAIIGLAFGRHLVLPRDELIELGMGLLLHDVGMAMLPPRILDKNGPLDEKEFKIMESHIAWSLRILEQSGGVSGIVQEITTQHHERWDGTGYPNRLIEDRITLFGSIGAIVDVYDAVTSERTYGDPMSAEEALKKMYEWRDKDFNGELIEEFIRCMGIFPIGSLVELSTGAIGVVVTINRSRRLKPKVALVLTANKTPLTHRSIIDLSARVLGEDDIKINRVLPVGTHSINPMDHLVTL